MRCLNWMGGGRKNNGTKTIPPSEQFTKKNGTKMEGKEKRKKNCKTVFSSNLFSPRGAEGSAKPQDYNELISS